MRKKRLILTTIIGALLVLSMIQVILSNNLSTTGIALAQLESEVAEYQRQNALLRETILIETSLTKIASYAASLGFSQGISEIVVSGSVPIAAKP